MALGDLYHTSYLELTDVYDDPILVNADNIAFVSIDAAKRTKIGFPGGDQSNFVLVKDPLAEVRRQLIHLREVKLIRGLEQQPT